MARGIRIANIRKNTVFLSIAGALGIWFIFTGLNIEVNKLISSGLLRIVIGVAILIVFGIGLNKIIKKIK